MGLDIGGIISGGLSGFASGGPLGAALGAAGGGLFGGSKGPRAPQVQFNPANINSGVGSATFDQESNTFNTSLDPRLAALQGGLFSQGQGFFDELNTFNPDEFGANVTQRLRNLAAPQEEDARLGLENRLFSQGLLNSTLGGDRQENLFTAQALADEARVARGFSLGQDVQGNLLNRGLQSFNAGVNLEQLPLQLLGLSLDAGQGNLGADSRNASNAFEASKLQSDTDSAFLGSFLNNAGALGGGSGNSFSTGFENFFNGTDFSDSDLDFFNNFDIG